MPVGIVDASIDDPSRMRVAPFRGWPLQAAARTSARAQNCTDQDLQRSNSKPHLDVRHELQELCNPRQFSRGHLVQVTKS